MKNNINKNIAVNASAPGKRTLSLAERLAFIDYVVQNTIKHGMEYRDLFIDIVISNYYYEYKNSSKNEISFEEIYTDIVEIKKEHTDFYKNELMDLIKIIDKKLNYYYEMEIHKNPANEAFAKLVDKLTAFISTMDTNFKDFNMADFQKILSQLTDENKNGDKVVQ